MSYYPRFFFRFEIVLTVSKIFLEVRPLRKDGVEEPQKQKGKQEEASLANALVLAHLILRTPELLLIMIT